MSPIFIITLIWTWHLVFMTLLTYAVVRAAYAHAGSPFRSPSSCKIAGDCRARVLVWPVSGRWLMAALLLMITLMISDVCRVSWRVYFSDYPVTLSWQNVIIRAAPVFIEPWTFWRQWRRGLINDYPEG